MELAINVVLAVIFALGLFIAFSSFFIPTTFGKKVYEKDGRPVIASIGEATIITAMLVDLSRMVRREPGDLTSNLRRSGWRYKNAVEYHSQRIIMSLVLVGAAIFALILYPDIRPIAVPIVIVAAIYGFMDPDRNIKDSINARREKLENKMAWGIGKISLLCTVVSVDQAMSLCASAGEFGDIAVRLAKGIASQRPFDSDIQDILAEYPESTKLRSFLLLVQRVGQRGADLTEPLQLMSEQILGGLREKLISEGKKADVYISLISSVIILLAILLVTVAPMALMFSGF